MKNLTIRIAHTLKWLFSKVRQSSRSFIASGRRVGFYAGLLIAVLSPVVGYLSLLSLFSPTPVSAATDAPEIMRGVFLGKILSFDKTRRTVIVGFIKPPHKRIEFQTDRRTRVSVLQSMPTEPGEKASGGSVSDKSVEENLTLAESLVPDLYISGLYIRKGQNAVLTLASVSKSFVAMDKKLAVYRKRLGKPKPS